MKASVIVLSWNGMEYLTDCLDAVLAQEYSDFEVIVVDNGSSDGSADFVEEQYPQARLIRNERNLGFAGGCNVGLRVAKGYASVLLNQDTQVSPGWLEALVQALDDPKIGVAGCKILYPDGETLQHAGGWIDWPLGLAGHYGYGKKDIGQWDEPRAVDYVTGAAMAFRRDVLEKVGFLDEEFWPGYYEDVDFCFRVSEAGYGVQYMPDAVLCHYETTSTDPLTASLHYQRGRLRFVLKRVRPDQILNEFLQAEERYLGSAAQEDEGHALRRAYLEAMSSASFILRRRWHADQWTVREVTAALAHLHAKAWSGNWERMKRSVPTDENSICPVELAYGPEDSIIATTFRSLQEFSFRSSLPIIGPVIAGFRQFWYNIAARHAVRFLVQQLDVINRNQVEYLQQQEAFNRSQAEYIQTLERKVLELHREDPVLGTLERPMLELCLENAILAETISRLAGRTSEPQAEGSVSEQQNLDAENTGGKD